MVKVNIIKVDDTVKTPKYSSEGAGCFDIYNYCPIAVTIPPKEWYTFRTGLIFEIPKDSVMVVYSRSGMGFKSNTRLSNCVGIIDSDYRGEVLVKLINDGNRPVVIKPNDRIAQAMVIKNKQVEFKIKNHITKTKRGANGFGSTGA